MAKFKLCRNCINRNRAILKKFSGRYMYMPNFFKKKKERVSVERIKNLIEYGASFNEISLTMKVPLRTILRLVKGEKKCKE